MLHERLKAAYDRDVVTFYTNFDKLHSPSCPVFDPWIAVGPWVGLLMLAVTVLFLGGLVAGTIAIVIAVVIYVMGVRPWLEAQFRDRAIKMALKDIKSFQTLWEYGGIGMAMTDRPETIIAAPDGPWKPFLIHYLPDIETKVLDAEMQNFVPEDIPDRRKLDLNTVVVPDLGDGAAIPPTRRRAAAAAATILPPEETAAPEDAPPAPPPAAIDQAPQRPQRPQAGPSEPTYPSVLDDPYFDQPFPDWEQPHQQEK
jgi:hypothetical protein